jgi:molecular chaperone DnaK
MSAIKAAVEKVATASQALGAALYANSQNEAGEAQAAGDDDVVDAEIVDENEKV